MVSLDQSISIASSAATILTAFATFLTVRQIRLQKEAIYRPDLNFERVFISGRSAPDGGTIAPLIWEQQLEYGSKPDGIGYTIPVHNIGLGAAKNISIDWDLSKSGLIDRINSLSNVKTIDVSIEHGKGWVSIKSAALEMTVSHNSDIQLHEKINHILPCSVSTKGLYFSLPMIIQNLISLIIYINAKNNTMSFENEIQIPIKIGFSDVANTRTTIDMKFKFHLTAMMSGPVPSTSFQFHGYFDIEPA